MIDKLNLHFVPSTVRQIGQRDMSYPALKDLFVLDQEVFGLQLSLELTEKCWYTLEQDFSVPWTGLQSLYRIDVQGENLDTQIHFEAAVLDDDHLYKNDRISAQTAQYLEKGTHYLWLDVKALKPGKQPLTVTVYRRDGYAQEQPIATTTCMVEVASVKQPQEKTFYLDLWQHLTALARFYQVPLWSAAHFKLIENFLEPLHAAGQKVCDLVISDYAWAGQSCYEVSDNPSSLYEYNIIQVTKQADHLKLDFSGLDQYIALCRQYDLLAEIDLFGILGNWSAKDFGNPLVDYQDPIRVRYFDVDQRQADFIKTRRELKDYLQQVFHHLQALGVWHRVKVMADEPNNAETFAQFQAFIQSCSTQPITFKFAVIHSGFLEAYPGALDSCSMISSVVCEQLATPDTRVAQHFNQMTWYTCCFPKNLNQFVRSPLMESRLVGYLTYAFGLKGFLRWNYCLWPEDPDRDIRYKTYKWAAGDMFFVYPGKSGRPEYSLRFKQLIYGINDFNMLKAFEKQIGRDKLLKVIQQLTGDVTNIQFNAKHGEITLNYGDDFNLISQLKRTCVQLLATKK
jgi:hypothetical protein